MEEDLEQRMAEFVVGLSPEEYERLGPVLREMGLALLVAGGVALAATVTCKVGVACNGTTSADTITGTTSNDTIKGLGGNDTIGAPTVSPPTAQASTR